MKPPQVLAFAGSTRTASFNKSLVKIAAAGVKTSGVEVKILDLRDFPLPLFDEDLEKKEGMPENAKKLKALMIEHDGFLIASPEYNSSISGVLKNAIDWASRSATKDEPSLLCFSGKAAALLSASPGGFGGLRGLVHLRSILGNMGMFLVPDQITISKAYEAFNENGQLNDAKKHEQVMAFGQSFGEFVQKLKG